MSRGGTKRARAAQDRKRRARARVDSAKVSQREKAKPKKKTGRGKAVLLHVMSIFAPVLLAGSLFFSGRADRDYTKDPPAQWADPFPLEDIVGTAHASYFSELRGFGLMVLAFALSAAVFWLLMVVLWRRIYRTTPFEQWDWSSVDQSITLMMIAGVVWLARAVFGYTLAVQSLITMVLLLVLYVPLFSAGLALILPVAPGTGRIGGVLPPFLRIPFTARFLLDEEQAASAAAAQEALKEQREAEREEAAAKRRERKKAKKGG